MFDRQKLNRFTIKTLKTHTVYIFCLDFILVFLKKFVCFYANANTITVVCTGLCFIGDMLPNSAYPTICMPRGEETFRHFLCDCSALARARWLILGKLFFEHLMEIWLEFERAAIFLNGLGSPPFPFTTAVMDSRGLSKRSITALIGLLKAATYLYAKTERETRSHLPGSKTDVRLNSVA